MINFDEQINLFKLIGHELEERTECIVVGGSAMLFYGAKDVTKDVDLVAMEKKAFDDIKEVLEKIGFKEKKLFTIFKHYGLIEESRRKPVILESKTARIDLFLKEIICFKISGTMLERMTEVHEFNNLVVKVVSPEDIILLKCATERKRDREDAFELVKKFKIKWDVVIKESVHQTDIGQDIFPVYLYDFLLELKEDLKADIPDYVIKEIRKIGERAMEKVLKKGSVRRFKPT